MKRQKRILGQPQSNAVACNFGEKPTPDALQPMRPIGELVMAPEIAPVPFLRDKFVKTQVFPPGDDHELEDAAD